MIAVVQLQRLAFLPRQSAMEDVCRLLEENATSMAVVKASRIITIQKRRDIHDTVYIQQQ